MKPNSNLIRNIKLSHVIIFFQYNSLRIKKIQFLFFLFFYYKRINLKPSFISIIRENLLNKILTLYLKNLLKISFISFYNNLFRNKFIKIKKRKFSS